ncbi:MAG: hypothetical protein WA053_01800 [Minisyncoccia bacterium]
MAMKQLSIVVNAETGEYAWIDRCTMNSRAYFPLKGNEEGAREIAEKNGWKRFYWLYLYDGNVGKVRIVDGTYLVGQPDWLSVEVTEGLLRELMMRAHAPTTFIPKNPFDEGVAWGSSVKDWVEVISKEWLVPATAG